MAIWQVDFHLIHAASRPPDTTHDGWAPPLLTAAQVTRAQELLIEYLGPPWLMVKDWLVYGPENGSRIDVVFEPLGTASVVFRFDARNDDVQLPSLACKLAKTLGCHFFSPDISGLIEPDSASLGFAIDKAHNTAVLRNLKIEYTNLKGIND